MGCMELSSCSYAVIGVPIGLRLVSQGIPGVAQRKPSQFSSMMGNGHCSEVSEGELVIISTDLG